VISVEQALEILHDNIPEPCIENVPLEQAYHCFSGVDIHAPEPSPRYTNSAMDGYAVRWNDCSKATRDNPVKLEIIGESQAGIPFDKALKPGTAIRISTGAMVPAGADTVVRIEDVVEMSTHVAILVVRSKGQDVRYQGEEFTQGTLLFPKGTCLGTRELALLAALGVHHVSVYMPPRVSLLITGTELARHDDVNIKPHQIRDSNAIMLASAIRESGAHLSKTKNIEDSLELTIAALGEAAVSGDRLILCSGGVSVGRHDHVKEAARAVGFTELFWKIRQKPGKPLLVSRLENTLLFGLPGNPVSAYMCFRNYVRPVLAELQGTTTLNHSLTARTSERVVNNGSRTNFIRVTVSNEPHAIPLITEIAQQGSHMLSSIVHADGYIIVGPGETLEPGNLAEVFLF
jgi:molybdopterin molybdotransferase